MESYRARWVFPITTEPIANGVITIDDGRIVEISAAPRSSAIDLGNVALLPGLVNAHTHLEFSDIAKPLAPATPFSAWIRAVVAHRRGRVLPGSDIIADGLSESRQCGVSLIGEIATDDVSAEKLRTAGQAGVVFRELIGLLPEQIEQQLAIARAHLEWNATEASPQLIHGLSPHAPYSVHPELFTKLVELCAEFRAPLAIHLAETREELELLDAGTGPLREMLQAFGVWRDDVIPLGSQPMDYLKPLAKLPRALVIHGNYLSDEEISFLAANPHITVVYCPRTHAFFGHSAHPWREMLSRGASLAIGTDSRASNPDLSIWRELQFLQAHEPDVSVSELLNLATMAGAKALGFENDAGSLEPGRLADLCIIALDSSSAECPESELRTLANAGIAGTFNGGVLSSGGRWCGGTS